MKNDMSKQYMPSSSEVLDIIEIMVMKTLQDSEDIISDLNNIKTKPWTIIVDDVAGNIDIYPADPNDEMFPGHTLIACKHWSDLIAIPMKEYTELCDYFFNKKWNKKGQVVEDVKQLTS